MRDEGRLFLPRIISFLSLSLYLWISIAERLWYHNFRRYLLPNSNNIVSCTRCWPQASGWLSLPRGPDSDAFSTWTEVRNGPTDAATRSRGRRTRERARGTRRARYRERGKGEKEGATEREIQGGGSEAWEGGFSRGKWGNKILYLYLSPSLSLSLFLSRSTKKGCQMRYRRL